jgi:hypothetical protein
MPLTEPLYDPKSFAEADEEAEPAEKPTDEEFSQFKDQVKEWTALDEQIKKLSVALRERRIHQRALGNSVQEFMRRFDYEKLETQNGRINSIIRMVQQPLKVADIRDQIIALCDEGLKGEALVSRIFDATRPMVERRSLRRSVPKVSLRLDI